MALALRLRRAIAASSAVLRPLYTATSSSPLPIAAAAAGTSNSAASRAQPLTRAAGFRSSAAMLAAGDYGGGEERKISPDEILFEGCDYNHWLITMEFPNDPKPTREEMIETYLQTLAKVVGSMEEAKKRMYAFSTTTYTGFQAVMTEEMSEKFRGLPGVVFILPDSYLYPETKEYGGDKYDNGVITPRPPPVHYGRTTRPRQNRYGNRPNYNSGPPQQGNFQNNPQQQGNYQGGAMHGDGRNYAPQQNYAPAGQDGRGYGPPGGRDFGYSQGERQDYYGPPGGYQDNRRGPTPPGNVNQGGQGYFNPQEQRNFSQGQAGNFRPAGPSAYGNYGQPSAPGYTGGNQGGAGHGFSSEHEVGAGFGHGGDNRRGAGPAYGGDNRQGAGSGYAQNYTGPSEGQSGNWQGRQ